MSTEKLIRITTLLPRRKGMSKEDFYKHWTNVHGPLVLDFMMRHGVVEYRQVSFDFYVAKLCPDLLRLGIVSHDR